MELPGRLKYRILRGPAHLCFIPTLNENHRHHDETYSPPLPFRGHLCNLANSKSYAIRGTLATRSPPASCAHHECLMEPPIYYDFCVHDYGTRRTWDFNWVKWWEGDCGWFGTEEDGGERFLDAEFAEFEAKPYVGFRTELMYNGDMALRYIAKYLKHGILDELSDEELDQIRVLSLLLLSFAAAAASFTKFI
ncbi:7316_t:CDS:2 [Ambispora leptoticha]|uniref:7316_t:CDS:1 n=1 Tax=Ambispora leptoticha TaxID=144679 RepID=A0A9N9AN65_9GLOM|nr:7316_t:CDS:2 [Ambispora leptoticha]